MVSISLCMIVKNEEAVLARCLDSIADAVDEIIIVDTGSIDKTKDIAGKYTKHIYDFEWVDDFSKARNEAFSKAACDYQMWLDADDVFPKDCVDKLIELKQTLDPSVDIVTMKYITHFDEHGNPILKSTRERLMRSEKNYQWMDPVHEYIPLEGKIVHSDIEVHHKKPKSQKISFRNLNIYSGMEKARKVFTPRQLYYFARELKDHGQWIKSIYYFEKFLESGKGWIEDNIAACHALCICYGMIEESKKVLAILTKSFEYDSPRAEICSEIGYYYKKAGNYAMALKWFELAAGLDMPDSLGFVLWDYWGYIPNIECCVCCCQLGDYKRANEFNEKAAKFKPNAYAVDNNRRYLATLIDN